ncbi:MAG: orotate phosphoribosyltransferase [Bdellovibrionales bacterium GWA2_49_15]|nr:MAG: orotate phosphoribosyltransferase [Bdellovibrionales bacterium GWA2_49_15]
MAMADTLIALGCVKFSPHEPFLYASGLKGPIYCDNRKILSHVAARELVAQLFTDMVKEWQSEGLEFDAVAGLATAGIPHATLLADRLKCPMIYIRSSAKEHGAKNQLEGDIKPGMRLLLIEDLVNQASSLEKACLAARQVETVPVGALAIVDYKMPQAIKILSNQGLVLKSLATFEDLVLAAERQQMFDQKAKDILMAWHNNPTQWSSDNSQRPT